MKKIILLSVLLAIVGVVIVIRTTKEAMPIPLPEPSLDAAAAFPQYDKIYRDKGRTTSIHKSKFVVFDYLQFHEDGTVVSTTRSVTSLNELSKGFYEDLAKELGIGGEGKLRQQGRYIIENGEVGYGLGQHGSEDGGGLPLDQLFDVYYGEIKGDQLWTKETQGKDKKPYGGFQPFAPVGPEARWDTMTKEE